MAPKKVKNNDNLEELETLTEMNIKPKVRISKKVIQEMDESESEDDDEIEKRYTETVSKNVTKPILKKGKAPGEPFGIKIVDTGFNKNIQEQPKQVIKKPLKKKIIQTIVEVETDDENEYIEPVKQKRQQSEKQKQNTERMRQRLQEYHAKKREEKALKEKLMKKEKEDRDNERKKELESKIVKKAISIKKKQIKKEAILDEISDDDTPIEEIKEIVKTRVIVDKPPHSKDNNIQKPTISFYRPGKQKFIYV